MLKTLIIVGLLLPILLISQQINAKEISPARLKQQVLLDQQCEKDRYIALAPRRKEIYQECLNVFKKSEKVCKEDAAAYNGNRINGAPLFYEKPSCVKAFDYKKETEKELGQYR